MQAVCVQTELTRSSYDLKNAFMTTWEKIQYEPDSIHSRGFNPKWIRIKFSCNKIKHYIFWQHQSCSQGKLKLKWNKFSVLIFLMNTKKLTELLRKKWRSPLDYDKHAFDFIPILANKGWSFVLCCDTYVSKQMGANREHRNVLTWGWQSVCTRCCQVVDFWITSAMLVCPIRLGSLISEYPMLWHMPISLGITTHFVDNPMSKPVATRRKPFTAKTSIFAVNNIFQWLPGCWTGSCQTPQVQRHAENLVAYISQEPNELLVINCLSNHLRQNQVLLPNRGIVVTAREVEKKYRYMFPKDTDLEQHFACPKVSVAAACYVAY